MGVVEKMFRNYIEFKVIETLGGGREQPIVKQESFSTSSLLYLLAQWSGFEQWVSISQGTKNFGSSSDSKLSSKLDKITEDEIEDNVVADSTIPEKNIIEDAVHNQEAERIIHEKNVIEIPELKHATEKIPEKNAIEVPNVKHTTETIPEKNSIEVEDHNQEAERVIHEKNVVKVTDVKHTTETETIPEKNAIEVADLEDKTETIPEKNAIEVADVKHTTETTPEKNVIEVTDVKHMTETILGKNVIEVADHKQDAERTIPEENAIEVADLNNAASELEEKLNNLENEIRGEIANETKNEVSLDIENPSLKDILQITQETREATRAVENQLNKLNSVILPSIVINSDKYHPEEADPENDDFDEETDYSLEFRKLSQEVNGGDETLLDVNGTNDDEDIEMYYSPRSNSTSRSPSVCSSIPRSGSFLSRRRSLFEEESAPENVEEILRLILCYTTYTKPTKKHDY